MVKIKAAVCHEFGAPLKIETIDLREPTTGEVEVTLGAVAVARPEEEGENQNKSYRKNLFE